MKKLYITLATILFISTIAVIALITFNVLDTAGQAAFYLVIAYVVFLLGFVLFSTIIGIQKMIQASKETKIPILRNGAIFFFGSSALIYVSTLIGITQSKGLLGNLAIPFGLAAGYILYQFIFLRNDKEGQPT